MIAVAELNQTIPFRYDEDPIVPEVVGRCVIIPPDRRGPCSIAIYSDDILAVELQKRGDFACSDCVERLLFPHLNTRESDAAKRGPKKSGNHWKSTRAPRGAQVHKGEDL